MTVLRPRAQTRDLASSGQSSAAVVASLAALKALSSRPASVVTQYRSTAGDGGGGCWVWRSGNQSAKITADPNSGLWAAPSSDATGASGAWERQFTGPVDLRWFGWSSSSDNGPTFQACHDALAVLQSAGATVLVPAGRVPIQSAVTFSTVPLTFVGAGIDFNPAPTAGTILSIEFTSASPFTITGTATRGTTFTNMAIDQSHPTIGVGWSPTVYPAVFAVVDTYGEFVLRNIFCPKVYQLVTTSNSGRTILDGIKGQFFYNLATFDACYDVSRVSNIHAWTYWTSSSYVLSWTKANCDLIVLGRCDTPFASDVFGFACHSIFKCITTGAGGPTKLTGKNLCSDASQYFLWSQATGFTAELVNLDTQCEDTGGAPLSGGRAILIDTAATYNQINIVNFRSQRTDGPAVEVLGNYSNVSIQNGHYMWWDVASSTAAVFKASATGSVINVGGSQIFEPIYPSTAVYASSGTAVVRSVLRNTGSTGSSDTDELRGYDGTGAVGFKGIGSSSTITTYLQPKGGTGRSVLRGSTGANVVSADDDLGGDTGILFRSGAADLNATIESSSTNANFSLTAKGTGTVSVNSPLIVGSGKSLQVGNAYVAGAPAATGYVTLKDSTGTTYKVLVST